MQKRTSHARSTAPAMRSKTSATSPLSRSWTDGFWTRTMSRRSASNFSAWWKTWAGGSSC